MNILRRSLRAKSCIFQLLILSYSFLAPAIQFFFLSGCFGLPVFADVAYILTFHWY